MSVFNHTQPSSTKQHSPSLWKSEGAWCREREMGSRKGKVSRADTLHNCFSSQGTQVPQKPVPQSCFKGWNSKTHKVCPCLQLGLLFNWWPPFNYIRKALAEWTSLLKRYLYVFWLKGIFSVQCWHFIWKWSKVITPSPRQIKHNLLLVFLISLSS